MTCQWEEEETEPTVLSQMPLCVGEDRDQEDHWGSHFSWGFGVETQQLYPSFPSKDTHESSSCVKTLVVVFCG